MCYNLSLYIYTYTCIQFIERALQLLILGGHSPVLVEQVQEQVFSAGAKLLVHEQVVGASHIGGDSAMVNKLPEREKVKSKRRRKSNREKEKKERKGERDKERREKKQQEKEKESAYARATERGREEGGGESERRRRVQVSRRKS